MRRARVQPCGLRRCCVRAACGSWSIPTPRRSASRSSTLTPDAFLSSRCSETMSSRPGRSRSRTSPRKPRQPTTNLRRAPRFDKDSRNVAEQLGELTRTHTCGAIRAADVGAHVVLLGWVHRVRDLGGLLFVDVRDREGVTQVVFDNDDAAQMAKAKRLRSEYVIGVQGSVRRRSADTINAKLETGEVEVVVRQLTVLNEAKTPPFPIADETPVSEDVRLKYRYLDLRRPRLASNMILRHKVSAAVRRYFDANGFLEVETPILTKSTPEGARDYLVPSRVHPGEFFALPQSPQLFKQILMIAGIDRYVQICKCFRDEDLRADRQPEFTQVDVEMSFARPDTIFGVIEPLMKEIFKVIGRDIAAPFPRMSYADAMARYGSDKPDLRCGMEIQDLRELFRESAFGVFKKIVADGGTVRALVVANAAGYSRSAVDG